MGLEYRIELPLTAREVDLQGTLRLLSGFCREDAGRFEFRMDSNRGSMPNAVVSIAEEGLYVCDYGSGEAVVLALVSTCLEQFGDVRVSTLDRVAEDESPIFDLDRFRLAVQDISRRPGMYMRDTSIDAYCAYLAGFDHACRGAPLSGFREWLVVRRGDGNNFAWPALAESAPSVAKETSVSGKIYELGRLVEEFLNDRVGRGERSIRDAYREWLKAQPWYCA